MASPSKEENVLKLILENSPLKEWHFEEIAKEAQVTKLVANKWLKKYVSEKLLFRIKKRGKFPYYTVGSNNLVYYSKKRIFALELLYKSGLLTKLTSLKNAKTIIIFGSTVKGDWYKNSDVDIFIFGNIAKLNKKTYEFRLKRNIELHIFQNKDEIDEVKTGLIQNIVNGYVLKGQIQDFAKVT